MAFQTLYDKLAEECDLDYIFVDLPPDHERLTMAFILSGHYILPPLHADFFSAASANRLLMKDGVCVCTCVCMCVCLCVSFVVPLLIGNVDCDADLGF